VTLAQCVLEDMLKSSGVHQDPSKSEQQLSACLSHLTPLALHKADVLVVFVKQEASVGTQHDRDVVVTSTFIHLALFEATSKHHLLSECASAK